MYSNPAALQAPRLQLCDSRPPESPRRARFVAIAGNIGAGKSTLTSWLQSQFRIQPFYEPNDRNPYLDDFYGDMRQFAFHSQIYFLSAKFRAHLDLAARMDAEPEKVFVQDRTIYEDAEIFARTLHARGVMHERDFQTYMGMYEGIRTALPKPDLLVFLQCSLKGVERRIRVRGRPMERAIDKKYLAALHAAYDAWYASYDLGPSLVIDSERLDYLDDLFDRQDLIAQVDAVLRGVPTLVPAGPARG
jgi:deoxyadenosine/deoxycytidine kinase